MYMYVPAAYSRALPDTYKFTYFHTYTIYIVTYVYKYIYRNTSIAFGYTNTFTE